MQTHIQKWGNSLGLRIPMQLAKQLQLHAGSLVILKIEEDRMSDSISKIQFGENAQSYYQEKINISPFSMMMINREMKNGKICTKIGGRHLARF